MKALSVVILALLGVLVIAGLLYAEVYTGSAENVEIAKSKLYKGDNLETPMGIKFNVVVKDSNGDIVARIPDYIVSNVATSEEMINAIKNEIDRKTMEIYAHIEATKSTFTHKSEIESYSKSIDKFVDIKDRPKLQSER